MTKIYLVLVFFLMVSFKSFSENSQLAELESALASSTDIKTKISLLLQMATVERANDLQAAIRYGDEATVLSREIKATALEAQSLLSLSDSYYAKGIYDDAITYALNALRLYEQLNSPLGLMTAYKAIGTVYLSMGQYEQANEYLEKATRYMEEVNDPALSAELLMSIAGGNARQGKLAEALQVMQQILAILKEQQDSLLYAAALNNMGRLHYLNGDLPSAATFYQQCIELGNKLNKKYIVLRAQINLSKVLAESEQPVEAEKIALQAHTEALASNAEANVNESALWLSELYEQQQNFAKALVYYREYIKYKDLQFNSEKSQQIADVQAKYDSDKKDAELALKQEIIQRQYIINIAITAFMLMFALSAGIAIKLYRDKKAANHLLRQQALDLTTAKNEIEHLANHDMLTGLPTIMLATDRIKSAISNSIRTQQKVALLFLDLDGFKQVNDTYGHEAGDLVLQTVALRLLDEIRDVDTACRIGGDEFLVLLASIENIKEVEQICQRLIASVGSTVSYQGSDLSIGVSIGAAIYPDHALEATHLRKRADDLMYQVKKSGKNNYMIAN